MKKYFIPVLLIASIFLFISAANEIQWISYDKAINLAKQKNQHVFIFFYADWCVYCKKMKTETFTDPKVIQVMNDHFQPVIIDSESNKTISDLLKKTGYDMAKYYSVSGLPTSIILKPSGEILYSIPGYIDKETFSLVLEYIYTNSYEKMDFNAFKKSKQ